jgi:hypothetical protein
MANALKFGLDANKWPPRQKKAFLKSLEEKWWKLNYFAHLQS